MIKIRPAWYEPLQENWQFRANIAPWRYSARGLVKMISFSSGWPSEDINRLGPVNHAVSHGNLITDYWNPETPGHTNGAWYFSAAGSDYWSCASSCGLAGANGATIVVGASRPAGTDLMFCMASALTGDPRFGLNIGSTGNATALASGATAYGTAASQPSGWHSWAVVFNGNATGNAERLKYYRDDAPVTLTYTGTIPATLSTAINRIDVARQYVGGTAGYGNGYYCQVFIYNRALVPDELYPMMASYGTATSMRAVLRRFHSYQLPMHYHGQTGGAAMFRSRAASRAKFAGQHRMAGAGQ